MKYRQIIFIILFIFSVSSTNAIQNSNPIANSDRNGYAKFTKLEFQLDESDRLMMFFLEFHTSPHREIGILGPFWHIPALSTNVANISEDELRWYAPNGKTYYFCSHLTEKKDKNTKIYFDNSGKWKAVMQDGICTIESKIDKSYFKYAKGRFVEFSLKDKIKHYILYTRTKNLVSSVKDQNGHEAFSFKYADGEKYLKSITTVKGTYNFKYRKANADILPSDAAPDGNISFLSEIEGPDGNIHHFKYSHSGIRTRTILMKDITETASKPIAVNKMETEINGEKKGWIEWCKQSGIIIADNGGEYAIGNNKSDFMFHKGNIQSANMHNFSAIKYKTKHLSYPALYMMDFDNLYTIKGDPRTGKITRHSKIATCGILKMRDRKLERLNPKSTLQNPLWDLIKSKSYDDKGRLIRELYANGDIKEWKFNGDKLNGAIEVFFNGVIIGHEKFTTKTVGNEKIFTHTDENGIISIKKTGPEGTERKYLKDKVLLSAEFFDPQGRLVRTKTKNTEIEYEYGEDNEIIQIRESIAGMLANIKTFKKGKLTSISNRKGNILKITE